MTKRNPTFYISDDKLMHFAENSAKMLLPSRFSGAKSIGVRLSENLRAIRSAVRLSEQYAAEGNRMPKPSEWLTDNWYIAEREGKGAIHDLKNIKGTRAADGKGKSLVVYAAEELVRAGSGEVTGERMAIFLKGFQNVAVLRESELAFFVPAMKAALVSELARIAADTEAFLKMDEEKARGKFQTELELASAAEKVVTSLRLLSSIDVSKILEEVNRTEQILQQDPSGVYPKMDDKTRLYYRRKVSELSRKSGTEEHKIAQRVLALAKEGEGKCAHVGYYLFEKPLGRPHKKPTGSTYITIIMLTSVFLALLLGYVFDSALIALLLLFPISEIVKNVTDFFVIKIVSPRLIFKLKLKEGVPNEGKTLCVISALLTSEQACAGYAKLLEEYRLSNRDCGENLLFGILADLPEAKERDLESDDKIISAIQGLIERLNEEYGGGFYLFTRTRVFSESNGRYMGWERKRGALLELVRLLSDRDTNLRVAAGNRLRLHGTRFIITLDSDTRLGVGTARELIGAMLHPLNKAEIDTKRRIVTSGHAILQPRVSVDLTSANRSDFTRLFAGQGGIDPYGNVTGDVYQDLFDEGSFTGKGIIDVGACLACLNHRFPENLVLSHDLLEGAYLRAGYVGDVEFSDGYPYRVLSYFERLHRWTRGDWQSARWLFGTVRDESGARVKNPLNQVNKWKIFDNLRRSTVPIFTFLAVYIGMLSSGVNFATAAVVAVLSAASTLLISSAELVFRRDINTRARYHSTIISGFGAVLTQTLIQLIFLPYNAYICFHAIFTALYRMFISKKNLLSWVTAADSERRQKDNLIFYFRKMYAPIILGILALFFSEWVAGAAVGAVWIFTPVYAISLSMEKKKKQALSADDRLFLIRASNDIWRYFDELCGPANNFLPPDNYQEQPYVGAAERTSPTNIGLALLSALAAMDMSLCNSDRAPTLIANMLTTVEKLPKWNGHLYNWYDTKTLQPLDPPYISSVDSGNLASALIALREGLLEKGSDFKSLAERANRLAEAMDFGLLFDWERQLFYIGREADGTPTEGWYDLMASEARQTSYLAIAKGQVGKKHWRRLGRVLVSKDNFSGMVSWTGTMFEYLMPNLLLPCYENSLLFESLKFCVYVQKRAYNPWGVSESAFYAFDPNLNYRYKAHGVGRLALKRGQDKECVISPYSSFLALQMAPKSAIKNLKKLAQMGMEGRYGYYEAADFTPMRQLGKKYEIVRCFMAHHLGMSLVAADNAVNDGIMQKRFMRDREMAAYAELLQEKVPIGQIVLKKPTKEVPEKPRMMTWQGWQTSGEGISFDTPDCTLLSNGSYAVAVSETGASQSLWRDLVVTRYDGARMGALQGINFFLKIGDKLVSLMPVPDYNKEVRFSHKFSAKSAAISAQHADFSSCVEVKVAPGQYGELRSVKIKNLTNKNLDAELVCYFEPVLARKSDYFAHPAFLKLAIETEFRDGVLIVKRRSNGKSKSVYAGFACDRPIRFDTMKETAVGRGGERNLKSALKTEAGNSLGAVLNPCVLVRTRISVKPSEETQVRYSLCVDESVSDVVEGAAEILKLSAAGANRVEESAKSLGAEVSEIQLAMEILRSVAFGREMDKERRKHHETATGAREALWKQGISGDIPIVTAVADSEDIAENAKRILKSHRILRLSCIKSDLVFVTNDGGDYRRPVKSLLFGLLAELGLENDLGSSIFIADIENLPELVLASSKVIDCKKMIEGAVRDTDTAPNEDYFKPGAKPLENLRYYFEPDNTFVIETNGALPPLAWSNILTNGNFGYLSPDCGTGHMWYKNARENKINVWQNDPLDTDGTEQIKVCIGGKKHSIFADADGQPVKIRFGFGFTEWEKEIDEVSVAVTAFIPTDIDARIIIIEIKNSQKVEKLNYFTDLVLGADIVQNGIKVATRDNLIIAENTGNTGFNDQRFITACSEKLLSFTDTDARSRSLLCVSANFKASDTVILVSGCDREEKIIELLDIEKAKRALEETKNHWSRKVNVLSLETQESALDRFMNGWALYQTIASRLLGRTSMYQNGGAYGFRDQLQDVSCIVQHHPEYAREQILRAARHQYVEGDVQHWWHPSGCTSCGDRGVRTKCSDDLLWLPYALCHYCEVTGDLEFCSAPAKYITSPVLKPGEHERYELPCVSDREESVFEHAKRALDMVMARGTGEHGLNFIGTGDWNDGFDRVGIEGRGESVWLTWFAAHVAERFSELCAALGKPELKESYDRKAALFASAALRAWDGKWFLRAYYDNGAPIGKEGSPECEIDSIAQSFSTWTKYSEGEKAVRGIKSAVDHLFDRRNGIVKLFSPPFSGENGDTGYIRGYVPGVRENGGQYTHAAVWLALGCFNSGLVNEGWDILKALLPLNHSTGQYKAEPFVLAADVYSNPAHLGRAGWNWYTGASAWYFRVVEEALLGLNLIDGKIRIKPKLPDKWTGYRAVWRTENAEFRITVQKTGKNRMEIDGEEVQVTEIEVGSFSGSHDVKVEL